MGGSKRAQLRLERVNPIKYGATRNHLAGAVTKLSPYINHGVILSRQLKQQILKLNKPYQAQKLLQQLTWREFFAAVATQNPELLWQDVEPYKTGLSRADYSDTLPKSILEANTNTKCINQFINELYTTGYIHNHARLYIASYIVHWLKVKWQVGAKWMLQHLLDGNLASNNFSWQWVASTFSHKPYFFNLENVIKYCSNTEIDTSINKNQELVGSYATISQRLFGRVY